MTFDKKDTGTGITKRVFCVFLAVSFFALAYINLTGSENIRLVSEQFPELNLSFRKAFVSGYKMSMSAAIFLIDVILVGPFAWLSYFGDHITPKRFPQLRKMTLKLWFFTVIWISNLKPAVGEKAWDLGPL